MNYSTQIAKYLLQIKAIKLNPQTPFTWASGIKSPIYCDNRLTLSYPEIRNKVIEAFCAKADQFGDFDVVVGVATAGIPHGALLANVLNKPFIYVRSKAKGHGRQNRIEGQVVKGQKALVIEDLISTGGSCLQAVEALKEEGIESVGVLAIFTYQFDIASAAFEKDNCKFDTISNYTDMLNVAIEEHYISEMDLDALKKWRENPREWGTIPKILSNRSQDS